MTELKNNQLRDCYNLEKGLTLFCAIRREEIFRAFGDLLQVLFREPRSWNKIQGAYHHLCSLLLERTFSYRGFGDLWQDYLLDFILRDENPSTLFLEKYPLQEMGGSLKWALERDLFILQSLFRVRGASLKAVVQKLLNREDIPCWEEAHPLKREINSKREAMKRLFYESQDFRDLLPQLSAFFKSEGAGLFNSYYAISWQDGDLKGISHPDPITLKDLIGYEDQKRALIKNTQRLLKGLPSSNALLYGDRGTGKSSTVKALINAFGEEGLRLIEVKAQEATQLENLYELLGERGLTFILYMDDLSFNENNNTFREVKALLEGRMGPLPPHMRIYATSNLRHLVQENFEDRDNEDLVHPGDLFQEKISLADRFGLSLVFKEPSMNGYFAMVETMAKDCGLQVEKDVLKREALVWSRRYSAPNGRTARQFVDYLLGEEALKREERVEI